MWVHEQELGGEQSMLEPWVKPIHAWGAQIKKSAFLVREGEREFSMLGGLWEAWSGANEAQGQAQASPKT